MVRYAVIPQIVPAFTSFTIYRWDINVRSATVIGLVGGGGIGFLLVELIRVNDMRGVSAVFIAIAVIVIVLDFVSAKVRERLI
jgi:phosphonate transport system permease protein